MVEKRKRLREEKVEKKRRIETPKIIAAVLWLSLIAAVFYWYITSGMSIGEFTSHIAMYVTDFIAMAGIWGGILYIFIYTIRPLIFFPATVLTALSGALFGPVLGIIYTIIGENLSANLAFTIARFFRKEGEYNTAWIAKIDKEASQNGLVTTLILRMIWAPFDAVNYGMGLTRVKHWEYAVGTFIGIIPGLTIFVLLGDALSEGISLEIFGLNLAIAAVLFVLTLVLAKYLKKRFSHLDVVEEEKSK